MKSIPPRYNPKEYEKKIADAWEKQGLFSPERGLNTTGKNFVVPMPPPNITGKLHIGHALTATLEDILVRYHRMKGDETLWIPGTDHAGIATQAVVEKELAKEGKRRGGLGREKFLTRVWEWQKKHDELISQQHRRLGASCDWSRERFTLDQDYQYSVAQAFKVLHARKLIFRGNYLVHWCPKDHTAISDDEVEHVEEEGALYFIKYLVASSKLPAKPKGADSNTGNWQLVYPDLSRVEPRERSRGATGNFLVVATTRPETLLGDVAVAVHPDDPRYTKLHNANLALPIAARSIPIITDQLVDKNFGSGAVKVTPGHDKADFELGERHRLTPRVILDQYGRLTGDIPERYRKLPIAQARVQIVKELEEADLIVKVQKIRHSVGHCYRCGTTIEPLLSKQWFVDLPKLVERTKLIAAITKDEVVFIPKRFKKVALHWLKNIRPWCISRQLWWGHPIPGDRSGDVLDTWFSSALWPFATLGWPEAVASDKRQATREKKTDYERYYPTTLLETGYDILFFWVLRMLVMGKELTGEWPFRTIYLHGLVRDARGKKMSKSTGNVVDPLELGEEFGTDALRMSLVAGTAPGNDLRFSPAKIIGYRNFANKIWNITRFIATATVEIPPSMTQDALAHHIPEQFRHYQEELANLITGVTKDLEGYRLSPAAEALYHFVWHRFADKILEEAKQFLKEDAPLSTRRAMSAFLLQSWGDLLALLHPFVPFVTEAAWEVVSKRVPGSYNGMLIVHPWPSKPKTHRHVLR